MTLPIFTDAQGRPLSRRPEPPGPGAGAEEWVAYDRARAAYLDAAADRLNAGFAAEFRKRLRDL